MKGRRWYLIHGGHRTTVAEVSLRVALAGVKRIALDLANTLGTPIEIMSGAPTDARLKVHNPTLVHHGLAKGAAYHLTSTLSGPVADVYVAIPMLARSIAQRVANALNERVEVTRNTLVGKGSVHSRAGSRSPGGGRSLIPSRNPAADPVPGEIWTTLGGGKCRVLAVERNRVQVLHLGSGNREWIGRSEFLSTYRPPRTKQANPRTKWKAGDRFKLVMDYMTERGQYVKGDTGTVTLPQGETLFVIFDRTPEVHPVPIGIRAAVRFAGKHRWAATATQSPRGTWWIDYSDASDHENGGLREAPDAEAARRFITAWERSGKLGEAVGAMKASNPKRRGKRAAKRRGRPRSAKHNPARLPAVGSYWQRNEHPQHLARVTKTERAKGGAPPMVFLDVVDGRGRTIGNTSLPVNHFAAAYSELAKDSPYRSTLNPSRGPSRRGKGKRRGGRGTRRVARRAANPAVPPAAVKTFRKWHAFDPERVTKIHGPGRVIPRTLVKLGEVPEIIYRSTKWDGKPVTYTHKTRRPYPVLTTDPDGRHLYLVGGRTRVTAAGLVD